MAGHFNPEPTDKTVEALSVVFQKTCDASDDVNDTTSIEKLKGNLNGNEITVVARSHAYDAAADAYKKLPIADHKDNKIEIQTNWTGVNITAKDEEERLISGTELAMRPLLYVGNDLVGDAYESAEGPGSLTKAVGNLPAQVTYEEFMAKTGGSVSKALDWIIWGSVDGKVDLPKPSWDLNEATGYKGSYIQNGTLYIKENPLSNAASSFTTVSLKTGAECSLGTVSLARANASVGVIKNVNVIKQINSTDYTHTDKANSHTSKSTYSNDDTLEVIDSEGAQGYAELKAYVDFDIKTQVGKSSSVTADYYVTDNKGSNKLTVNMTSKVDGTDVDWSANEHVTATITKTFKFYDAVFYGWAQPAAINKLESDINKAAILPSTVEALTANDVKTLLDTITGAEGTDSNSIRNRSAKCVNGNISVSSIEWPGGNNCIFYILCPSYAKVSGTFVDPNSNNNYSILKPASVEAVATWKPAGTKDNITYKLYVLGCPATNNSVYKTNATINITGVPAE